VRARNLKTARVWGADVCAQAARCPVKAGGVHVPTLAIKKGAGAAYNCHTHGTEAGKGTQRAPLHQAHIIGPSDFSSMAMAVFLILWAKESSLKVLDCSYCMSASVASVYFAESTANSE